MNDKDRKQVAEQLRARGFRVSLTEPGDQADKHTPVRDRAKARVRRMGLVPVSDRRAGRAP